MSDQALTILFDKNIYSAKAVKRALYEINASMANLNFEVCYHDNISVTFSMIGNDWNDADKFIEKFKGLVFDHQIRLDTEEEYRLIRQMIVAQAFHPCDNIQEIIDTYEL